MILARTSNAFPNPRRKTGKLLVPHIPYTSFYHVTNCAKWPTDNFFISGGHRIAHMVHGNTRLM